MAAPKNEFGFRVKTSRGHRGSKKGYGKGCGGCGVAGNQPHREPMCRANCNAGTVCSATVCPCRLWRPRGGK